MYQPSLKFSLNHMVCPHLAPRQLVETTAELGLDAVKLRNDGGDNSITKVDQARAVGARAHELGIQILSINALYPFNIWNDERAIQA